jgi:hypothetical protein
MQSSKRNNSQPSPTESGIRTRDLLVPCRQRYQEVGWGDKFGRKNKVSFVGGDFFDNYLAVYPFVSIINVSTFWVIASRNLSHLRYCDLYQHTPTCNRW